MDVRDYRVHDGLGLAALIRAGEVSVDEVFAAACAGIEADNPVLGAVVRTRFEQAAREGRGVDPAAPFAGVPTLTKDLLMALERRAKLCDADAACLEKKRTSKHRMVYMLYYVDRKQAMALYKQHVSEK